MTNQVFDQDHTGNLHRELQRPRTEEEIKARQAVVDAQKVVTEEAEKPAEKPKSKEAPAKKAEEPKKPVSFEASTQASAVRFGQRA